MRCALNGPEMWALRKEDSGLYRVTPWEKNNRGRERKEIEKGCVCVCVWWAGRQRERCYLFKILKHGCLVDAPWLEFSIFMWEPQAACRYSRRYAMGRMEAWSHASHALLFLFYCLPVFPKLVYFHSIFCCGHRKILINWEPPSLL